MISATDIEIERSVLGALMAFEEHREKTLLLYPDDFQINEHKIILSSMREQMKDQGDFDFLTIAKSCGDEFRNEIQACVQLAISAALFEEHFRLLKEAASRRRLLLEIDRLGMEGTLSVFALQKIIEEENERRIGNSALESTKKSIEEFVAKLNKQEEKIFTGFKTFDKALGGIRKGTVFIVGARPSVGKTSFALNVTANLLSTQGSKIMFFSLEMTAPMILERLMAISRQIQYKKFGRNNLDEKDILKIKAYSKEIQDNGSLLIMDDVYNADLICNLIRENKPTLAVVDFMQIISVSGKFENVRSKIDYISSQFKRTAKDTGCVILVLSQLTRAGRERPTMSDLKESGGLEQDGDYIALLHRPYVLDKGGSAKESETELLLDKNKFGKVGNIDLYFDLEYQRFSELENRFNDRIDYSGNPFEEESGI